MTARADVRPRQSRILRGAVYAACVAITAALLPRYWYGRGADALLDDDPAAHAPLGREVAAWAISTSGAEFHTGSARFDGEWGYVACMMAVLGLGQRIEAEPSLRSEYLPAMRACVDRMSSAQARAFGTEPWRQDGLANLESNHGHAYLGYFNLALGMLRLQGGDDERARLHDELSSALLRRIESSPTGLIETYPGEIYPPDVCAVAGSLGLHARAGGVEHDAAIAAWVRKIRANYIEPSSGLLMQSTSQSGAPLDQARASGTAVCAYMVSFASPQLSRDLYSALRRTCALTVIGFGAMREYPRGAQGGWGDIDSGPVLFGVGLSASGFAVASARMHGDREMFRALWRSATLFGVPVQRGGRQRFLTGGPLGNATLLAMSTARLGSTP